MIVRRVIAGGICTVGTLVGGSLASGQDHAWPIDKTSKVHALGNSSREFQLWPDILDPFYHGGVDIPMPDPRQKPRAVRAVIDGRARLILEPDEPRYSIIELFPPGTKGTRYVYVHVDSKSVPEHIPAEYERNGFADVKKGDSLGIVVDWHECDFHHLHFAHHERCNRNGKNCSQIDPLMHLDPNKDSVKPVVDSIYFAMNESDTYFDGPVSGDVDIVAEMFDRVYSGWREKTDHKTGISNATFRIERKTGSDWNKVSEIDSLFPTRGEVPPHSSASTMFKTSGSLVSNSNVCLGEKYYYVLTNRVGPNPDGFWDTDGGSFPDGRYRIVVRAWDQQGKTGERKREVEVANRNRN
ncbi:MAG: hypothetical protein ACREF4_06050 [Gammaproteobacteria bacterium]